MSNYKETTLSGSEYTRCAELNITNPLGGIPQVRFVEEQATVLSNRTILEKIPDNIVVSFDPNKTFEIIDPNTGIGTGITESWSTIYGLIYSAYIAEALNRDSQV